MARGRAGWRRRVSPGDAAAPCAASTGGGAENRADGLAPIVSQVRPSRVARHVRPDLFDTYPAPETNYAHGLPFGLTLDALRAEWKRCAAAGFAEWELRLRLDPRRGGAA